MNQILVALMSLPPALILVAAFGLPAVEASALIGLVIPGESAVFVAGLAAHQGRLPLWSVIVVAVAGALLGDQIGFTVGRRLGPRLLGRLPHRLQHSSQLDRAASLLRRRGALAVVLGRWTALLRALMPGLAGASGMPRRTFVIFNVLGGATWAVAVAVAGFIAGAAYERVAMQLSHASIAILAIGVSAVLVVHLLRRRQRRGGSSTSVCEAEPALVRR